MSNDDKPDLLSDYTQAKGFWGLMLTAVLLGVIGAVAGLVFLGVTGVGADWYGDPGLGWFDGEWWWVAVAAGAGLLVGLLRRLLRMPEEIPGLIEDLQSEHIDTKTGAEDRGRLGGVVDRRRQPRPRGRPRADGRRAPAATSPNGAGSTTTGPRSRRSAAWPARSAACSPAR